MMILLFVHDFGCNAPGFGVGLYVDVVVGLLFKGGLSHGLLYDVAHVEERALPFAEAQVHYFVGGIHYARACFRQP